MRKRLTREERKQLTREQLLAAAAMVFGERGFAGASVDEIAERAGYSKGAVYSNFEDKESLFLALIDQHLRHDQALLKAIVDNGGPIGDALSRLDQFTEFSNDNEQMWTLLTLEFFMYSMRHEGARARLAKLYQAQRDSLASLIEKKSEDKRSALASSEAATLVIALGSGLAIQRLIDGKAVPDDLLLKATNYLSGECLDVD